MNALPTLKATSTSTENSCPATKAHDAKTPTITAVVDQKFHPEREVMLPPEQADKLLP